jgi:hypothetical protein
MKLRITLVLVCILGLAHTQSAYSFEVSSMILHLHLSGMKEARPPEVLDGYLVLSARGPYRFVGASFSHEDWRTVHAYQKNLYGVFVLAVPLPYSNGMTTHYRLVVDGLWMSDPINPWKLRDPETGVSLSAMELPGRPRTVLGTWDPAGESAANFYFAGEPGQRVTVAGSFNSWDPFIHELAETSPGVYELSLQLSPGEYHYVFVYRGRRIPDPLNRQLLYSSDGRPVSGLSIAKR